MKIRFVQDSDYAAIARLRKSTIRNVNSKDYSDAVIRRWSGRKSANDFRKTADKGKILVALDENKVIGFCEHGLNCELWSLYIDKKYLRKGVGSRLNRAAEKSMKKMGCKKVTLKSTVTAEGFYAKQGYKNLGKDIHKSGRTRAKIFNMEKML